MLDFDTSNPNSLYSFWGHSPPEPLLQRSTTGFSPLPQKILDPPLYRIYWPGYPSKHLYLVRHTGHETLAIITTSDTWPQE